MADGTMNVNGCGKTGGIPQDTVIQGLGNSVLVPCSQPEVEAPDTVAVNTKGWRYDRETRVLFVKTVALHGISVWMPEQYVDISDPIYTECLGDADFAAIKASLPGDGLIDLTQNLPRICSSDLEDDPQAERSGEDDEVDHEDEVRDDPIEDMSVDVRTQLSHDMQPRQKVELSRVWELALEVLVEQTASQAAKAVTKRAMSYFITQKCNQALYDRFCDATELVQEGVALVGAVWLSACYYVSHKRMDNGWPSDSCSAMLYSLWYLHDGGKFGTQEELFHAVRCWEHHLDGNCMSKFFKEEVEEDAQIPSNHSVTHSELRYTSALESVSPHVTFVHELMRPDPNMPKTPVDRILEDERTGGFIESETMQMIASMHVDVLLSCAEGRLAQHARMSDHYTEFNLRLNAKETDKPVIYVQSLVDKASMSPTPYQLRQVVDLAYRYIDKADTEFDVTAIEIDSQISTAKAWRRRSRAHHRRYCDFRQVIVKKQRGRDTRRREIVRSFLDRLSKRLTKEYNRGRCHAPLVRPLTEIGFTKNMLRRLTEHRHHSNSNYIMCLFEAIFRHIFGERFVLQQDIVHVCWRASQPWLGEVYLHKLLQGYTYNARGFSHYPAGCSNSGAYTATTTEDWHKWHVWADRELRSLECLGEERGGLTRATSERRMDFRRESKLQNVYTADTIANLEEVDLDIQDIQVSCEIMDLCG